MQDAKAKKIWSQKLSLFPKLQKRKKKKYNLENVELMKTRFIFKKVSNL